MPTTKDVEEEEETAAATTGTPSQLATTVSNLVVTPQQNGVSLSFTTGTPVRARLQIGTASGTYTTYTSPYGNAVISIQHLLYGANLAANTLYHYIVQFYDQNGGALDATVDATFTTLAAPAGGAAPGTIIGPLLYGSGVPAAGMGQDGMFYFRSDGAAGAAIYQRRAGTWVATTA